MAALDTMTFDQYVAWQSEQSSLNEYVAGKVVPRLPGAARKKVRERLVALLRERALIVAEPGLMVLDDDARQAFCPDVVVLRKGPRIVVLGGLEAVLDPLAVVEIVEPGATEGEWRPRSDAYRGIPALREFAEVYLQGRLADGHERHEEGWLYRIAGKGCNSEEVVSGELSVLGRSVSVARIYEDFELPG